MVFPEYSEDIFIDNEASNGLILFHGIFGNAFEQKTLAEKILPGKLDIFIPTLPHHGTNHKDLENRTIKQYIDWGVTYIESKSEDYDNLFVFGLSMGAIIAALASLQVKRLKGLILSSLPLSITRKALFLDEVRKLTKIKSIIYTIGYLRKSNFFTEDYLNWRRRNFNKMPLDLIMDIHSNLDEILEKYKKIDTPMLLFFGCKDPLINAKKSAEFIYHNARSNIKKIYILDKCDHWIHFGKSIEKMCPIINEYIEDLLQEKYPVDKPNISFLKI